MIRNATHEDVNRMVELGALMHAESKFRAYSFDPWKLAATIGALIDGEDGIAIVAEEDGEIVGGFIGFLSEHYFGRDKASYDLALFLQPEHRVGTLAMRLIRAYIKVAKEKGASEVVIANSTGVAKERVARLFEHAGFKHDGFVFSMNVKEA
mgnify:CR=1 FL=1